MYNIRLAAEISRVTILKPSTLLKVTMRILSAILLLVIMLAPNVLLNIYAQGEEKVEIVEGSKNIGNGKFYTPKKITIPVGTSVIWNNSDDEAHTVTDGTAQSIWGTVFDSGIMRLDDVYEFTFNQTGTYPYLCALHPWMLGSVTVLGEGGEVPVELYVKLERASYQVGDNVDIEGSVSTIIPDIPLLIEVLNPNDENLVKESLTIDNDGNFIYNLKLSDKSIFPGSYTVKVNYSDASAEGFFVVEVAGENADARVVSKQIRNILLVRVRNAESSTASIYGVTIETSDSVIQAFKGPRSWNTVDMTSSVGSASVGEEPLIPGDKALFKLKVANDNFTIKWTVYDASQDVLDQGEAKPVRR